MFSKFSPITAIVCFVLVLFSAAAAANEQEQQASLVFQTCDLDAASNHLPQSLSACQELAELGHRHAQFQMGNFYSAGILLPQDYMAAVRWYTQASSQGHPQAQLQLGLMYARGIGVPANKAQAFIILKMSAINGSDVAYDYADQILLEMSSQELDIANRVLARIFFRFVHGVQHSSQAADQNQLDLG